MRSIWIMRALMSSPRSRAARSCAVDRGPSCSRTLACEGASAARRGRCAAAGHVDVGQRQHRLTPEHMRRGTRRWPTRTRCHLLGRALGHDAPAASAALGAQVDDPVGRLDDVEVVLDDDDGVAVVDEPVQHLQQLLDIGEVQAGGGLVEDVDGAAGGPLGQLGGQLHALRLAARERRRRLAQADVAEADVDERGRACCAPWARR